MNLRERWTRYCLKIECEICGDSLFNTEEDARDAVELVIEMNGCDENSPIESLRDGLTWLENGGKWCDYHTHVMSKDC